MEDKKQKDKSEQGRISSSPVPPPESSSSSSCCCILITPKVEYEQSRHLLSPPPAPLGLAYDESEILTNSYGNSEQRQSEHCRQHRNMPILEFPLTSALNDDIDDANNRGSGRDDPITPISRPLNLPIRRRRANSLDAFSHPRISLRPRFTTQRLSELRRDESSPRDIDSTTTPDFQQLRLNKDDLTSGEFCDGKDSNFRPGHVRSRTDSSFFDSVLFQMPSLSSGHMSIPTFPRSLLNDYAVNTPKKHQNAPPDDEDKDLPSASSRPKSNFGYPTNLCNTIQRPIPRPMPRYNNYYENNRSDRSYSPPNLKRFCMGTNNASEAATTGTLSSSNNSAFNSPLKVTKNPTSPLSNGSDSKTQELSDAGDDDNNYFIPSRVLPRGLPLIPHCDERDTMSAKPTVLGPRLISHGLESDKLPFDEVTLSNENDLKGDDKLSPNS